MAMGRGLLGAFEGAGKGLAQAGQMLMADDLENLRVEKMAKIKEGQVEKQQEFKAGEGVLTREAKASEGLLDRQTRIDVANIGADAKRQAAKDKAAAEKSGGKPSAAYKQYNELVGGQLGGIKYPQDWAVGIAYGGHKTTTDPRTKEMILLGPDSESKTGFSEVGRMQPSIPKGAPGSRRSPKEWTPAEKPDDDKQLPAGDMEFRPVKLNTAGRDDGLYTLRDGRILKIEGGKAFLKK